MSDNPWENPEQETHRNIDTFKARQALKEADALRFQYFKKLSDAWDAINDLRSIEQPKREQSSRFAVIGAMQIELERVRGVVVDDQGQQIKKFIGALGRLDTLR